GRYAGSRPPIAVTALPTPAPLASTCATTAFPCAAIWTTTPTAFTVQGTVYLPNRELVLTLNNSSTQSIRGGAIGRRAWASTTRTAAGAIIETPSPGVSPRAVAYLNVYVCVNSATCDSGGEHLLSTKVSIVDSPTGRQVTVLSWSLQD